MSPSKSSAEERELRKWLIAVASAVLLVNVLVSLYTGLKWGFGSEGLGATLSVPRFWAVVLFTLVMTSIAWWLLGPSGLAKPSKGKRKPPVMTARNLGLFAGLAASMPIGSGWLFLADELSFRKWIALHALAGVMVLALEKRGQHTLRDAMSKDAQLHN